MKVLMVEDDENDAALQTYQLQARGLEVVLATTAEQAYVLALSCWPRIALCDMLLFKSDGYAFADRMKANPLTAHIPLIAITGHTFGPIADRTHALEVGFDALLHKPLDIDEFMKEVARLCPS